MRSKVSQKQRIYDQIAKAKEPGITTNQIANRLRIDPGNVSRRVSDLRQAGVEIDTNVVVNRKGERKHYYSLA